MISRGGLALPCYSARPAAVPLAVGQRTMFVESTSCSIRYILARSLHLFPLCDSIGLSVFRLCSLELTKTAETVSVVALLGASETKAEGRAALGVSCPQRYERELQPHLSPRL